MKVGNLQLFLRSLQTAVQAAGGHPSLPTDLEAVSAGLEPFSQLDLVQFTAFLRQAEQYRSSGNVSMPVVGPGAEEVQANLRMVSTLTHKLSGTDGLDERQAITEREEAQRGLQYALDMFLKPLGITVTFKDNKKAFQASLKQAAVRALAGRVRTALSGVTDEASLNSPERQERLRAILDPLPLPDLKTVALELGAPTSRKKDALVSAIVERITGVKPAAKKPPRPRAKPAVDQAAVQQQAVKLKGLLERSFDPGGLSNVDLEGAMSELNGRNVEELKAIAKELALDNIGKTKPAILKQIKEKLQEAERARESIQV
jgi:hypothetical protein